MRAAGSPGALPASARLSNRSITTRPPVIDAPQKRASELHHPDTGARAVVERAARRHQRRVPAPAGIDSNQGFELATRRLIEPYPHQPLDQPPARAHVVWVEEGGHLELEQSVLELPALEQLAQGGVGIGMPDAAL